MKQTETQRVLGRQERADFPKLNLSGVILKIDTGAYSSAIHCSRIEMVEPGVLGVVFLEDGDSGYTGEEIRFRKFQTRQVKSSNGVIEERFAIITRIALGKETFRVRMTLTDRSTMRIPVLIGRRFLKLNNFIVDPGLINSIYYHGETPPEEIPDK